MRGKGQLIKKQVKGKKWIFLCVCLIAMAALFFIIDQENEISYTRGYFDGTPTEAEVKNQNGDYYKITCKTETFAQDNCIDNSSIHYPAIEFAQGTAENGLENEINRLLYETSRLHYNKERIGTAAYLCDYSILSADENYICIYYEETIAGGVGWSLNFEDAITISLKTGKKVSLNEWKDIDQIFREIKNYRGIIYTDRPFDKEAWKKNKDELIEDWREDKNAEYHGYYLYNGRLGLLFGYYQTEREKIELEFEGIQKIPMEFEGILDNV